MTSDAQIRAFIDRILRLKEEQDTIGEDIRDIYAEAKSMGFDKTAMGQVVQLIRKRGKIGEDAFSEQNAIVELYLSAYEGPALVLAAAVSSHTPAPARARENIEQFPKSDGGEVAAVKGHARLANAAGVEPPPSEQFDPETGEIIEEIATSAGGESEEVAKNAVASASGPDVKRASHSPEEANGMDRDVLRGDEIAQAVPAENARKAVPETEDGSVSHAGAGESPAANSITKPKSALRPNCRNPEACGGYGANHCHSCRKATGDKDLTAPLDVERITKGGLKYLTVMTRRHLTAGKIERDPASEWYGKPKVYQLNSADGAQIEIHPSRLVIFNGSQQPDEDIVTTNYAGWGDSVLLSVVHAIKQADGTAANIASLVFEAKVNVIRIPDFMQNLGNAEYRAKILERYTLAATAKGINGDLLLDKEEEYEQKTASFATLPDVLMSFLQIVSGAADIPATRLLGQSPAGMNATGESDLRNYYDRLQAMQTVEMTPAMARLDECLIRSALGSRDPDIYYEWAPLWGMSEKEKADVFKTKADAARQLVGSGTGQEIIPREAVSDALVNTFIEDGSLPGLDAAIEEYGKLSEQEPDEEERAAAATQTSAAMNPSG